ncbi:hypothetical protein TNCV_355021 [Trichonephila clavipes]|uniref:Uncharacterized protein n=1 Tax=Trichonephila clavipes TaxID=2585209 RepID=A0A8X6W1M9_TRICX|nr:hypothetical protein TNCV_355021 [Trichonephila clavipes]
MGGCRLVFNHCKPSTFPEADISFYCGTYRRISNATGNFDAQFTPQRKAPELCQCKPVLAFYSQERLRQRDTLGILHIPYNPTTWPLSIFCIIKIRRLGSGVNP